MLTLITDNVRSLLADLGFENGSSGSPNEIAIDRFDHWTNPESAAGAAALTACSMQFGQLEAAA